MLTQVLTTSPRSYVLTGANENEKKQPDEEELSKSEDKLERVGTLQMKVVYFFMLFLL